MPKPGEEGGRRQRRSNESQVIHYQVNGEQQRTERAILTVKEILQHAGSAAAIDMADLDSYYLEDMASERQYRGMDEPVNIKDGDQFLAVYSGRTPVA